MIYCTVSRIIQTEVWIILDIMRKLNPIIVLLYSIYIQNIHTKMQTKCVKRVTCDYNLEKFFFL